VPPIVGVIVIERPVEEVFDIVADERNEPRYNPRLVSVEKASSGPIGPGTRWRAETTMGRRRIPMTIDVTAYDRPRRLASRTRLAGMEITGELSFEPVSNGTRMQWCWQLQPRGPLKLLGPLIARHGERQEQAIWHSLKRFLEGAPRSPDQVSVRADRAVPRADTGEDAEGRARKAVAKSRHDRAQEPTPPRRSGVRGRGRDLDAADASDC
jgi:uncharacterized membrane protein